MLTGKSIAETHRNQRLIDFWPPCWPLRFCQSLASVFGESVKDQDQCYRRRWTRRWSASTATRPAGSRRTPAPWLRWRREWRARQLWRGTALKRSSSASCFSIISSRKPRSTASFSKGSSTRLSCVANHYVLTGFASLNIFLPELCFKVNIQEEAKSTGPKESETDELSVGVSQNGHFKPRQPRWNNSFRNSNFFSSWILILGLQGLLLHAS